MKMKKIFFYVILLLTLTCERSNRQAKIEEVNQENQKREWIEFHRAQENLLKK